MHGTRADSPRTFGEGESMQQVADDIARAGAGETMAVWGDMTREEEVVRCADEVRQRWGRIDVLVCCAGGDTRVSVRFGVWDASFPAPRRRNRGLAPGG